MDSDWFDEVIEYSGLFLQQKASKDIEAYLEYEECMVVISYPDAKGVWVKRDDRGSHSQLRWSLYDDNQNEIVQLVVKHNSCLRALILRPLCRTCERRKVWKLSCETPENIFYILSLVDDVSHLKKLLEPLIKSRRYIKEDIIARFRTSIPKPALIAKMPKKTERRRKSNEKLERSIEQDVINGNANANTFSNILSAENDTDLEKTPKRKMKIADDNTDTLSISLTEVHEWLTGDDSNVSTVERPSKKFKIRSATWEWAISAPIFPARY